MNLQKILLITALIYIPAVYADHLSLEEVEALEQQCLTEQEPIFKSLRELYIAECEVREKKSRGDPADCAERFNDIKPVKKYGPQQDLMIILNPPLPICVKAEEALDHYHANP